MQLWVVRPHTTSKASGDARPTLRPESATESRPHPNLNDTGISLDGEAVCRYDTYATIRLESQLTRKMVNSEGLIVAGEAQILASAVADLLRYSHIPSFQYSVTRVSHHSIHGPGRAGSEACDCAKQTQFPDGATEANFWSGRRLREKVRAMRLRKQSQFGRSGL